MITKDNGGFGGNLDFLGPTNPPRRFILRYLKI